MFRVKICGITVSDDARMAVECGADAIGLNFCPQSPRFVDPSAARRIVDAINGKALVVAVFVNESADSIRAVVEPLGIGAVQLSGDESAELAALLPYRVLKAIRPSPGTDLSGWSAYPCEAFLLDAHRPGSYGGTGVALDWSTLPAVAETARDADGEPMRWLLAGGLTPDNVREAIATCRPFGVDVASGVESAPGKKDRLKVYEFIQRAKEGLAIART